MLDALATLDHVAAIFLALVAALSAGHKVAARDRSLAATARLLATSPSLSSAAWALSLGVEALGAVLLLGPQPWLGGAVVAALWSLYTGALMRAWHRGVTGDCGCSFGRHARLGRLQIVRSGGLAMLGAWVAVAEADRAGFWDTAVACAAAIAFLTLYLAFDELAAARRVPAEAA